ncbi:MAG: glutamate formiminotransferase [Bacteroidota bacterium]|nr:glutamate formiminotransferase [Bacteroidota bacterium]
MFSANDQIIECVPNFSEGRDPVIIEAIANSIKQVPDVKLMHIDIGFDANRTVFTFAGKPGAVAEAAYNCILTASELIDMQKHKGEHPRMGACDVFPLIPLHNITMDEVVDLSKVLGKRIGDAGIPVYLYEHSASTLQRKDLTYLRKGEYEEIKNKILLEEWSPDYGPREFNSRFGMMALGARNFLLAYNINLKTTDVSIAKQIAKQVRIFREKNDDSYESNLFQHVKAIGWVMQEFNCAQVSTNITDIDASPITEVFSSINKLAAEIDIETDGSELIGLIPERALTNTSMSVDEAIDYLGLNAVDKFDKNERIIEYNLGVK